MNVGSLFTGIGGFDLGLERAGMRVVWQCESDDYCRRVLAKHWPHVPCFEDVRDLSSAAGTPRVDVLCGGFPCQDISLAGKGAGIDGAHSGLWAEYARLVGELRPRYVVVENVSALLARGMGRVLGDLAALGYDAEWDCIPASAVGAPHQRDRVWLVAYPAAAGLERQRAVPGKAQESELGNSRALADASRDVPAGSTPPGSERERVGASGESSTVADPAGEGWQPRRSAGEALPRPETVERFGRCSGGIGGHWLAEPDVGRVADGVPQRVDRLRSLGNALVPPIAEWIGRRIMSYEAT